MHSTKVRFDHHKATRVIWNLSQTIDVLVAVCCQHLYVIVWQITDPLKSAKYRSSAHLIRAWVLLLQSNGSSNQHHTFPLLTPVQLVAKPLLTLLLPLPEFVSVPGQVDVLFGFSMPKTLPKKVPKHAALYCFPAATWSMLPDNTAAHCKHAPYKKHKWNSVPGGGKPGGGAVANFLPMDRLHSSLYSKFIPKPGCFNTGCRKFVSALYLVVAKRIISQKKCKILA